MRCDAREGSIYYLSQHKVNTRLIPTPKINPGSSGKGAKRDNRGLELHSLALGPVMSGHEFTANLLFDTVSLPRLATSSMRSVRKPPALCGGYALSVDGRAYIMYSL